MANYAALLQSLVISGSRKSDGTANASGKVASMLQVCPRSSQNGIAYGRDGDAVLASHRREGFTATGAATDVYHVRRGELGEVVATASRRSRAKPAAFVAASLGHHVSGVVRRSPEKQMAGTNALSVVAPVENEAIGRNRPSQHPPGKSMRGPWHAVTDSELPITTGRQAGRPFPAPISDGDMPPESLYRRGHHRKNDSTADTVGGTK